MIEPVQKGISGLTGFFSRLLDATGLVDHIFCSRLGGFSRGVFSSLNLSLKDGDDTVSVSKNRAKVCNAFGIAGDALITLEQVHGGAVVTIDGFAKPVDGLKGDGIITDRSDLAIGILTADCLPLLILEPETRVIAAIHAGWRGLVAGVIEEGLDTMEERYSIKRERVMVAIGPSIKGCCYTVGEDVAGILKDRFAETQYIRMDGDGIHVELASLAVATLERAGIREENIEVVGPCTSCDKRLVSYRRDGRTGRQISLIRLR